MQHRTPTRHACSGVLLLAAAALAVCAGACDLSNGSRSRTRATPEAREEPATMPGLTMANYHRIKPRMTLAQVERLLGKGKEQASSTSPGLITDTTVKVYGWQRGMRAVNVVFVNGKMDIKSQAGLD